MKGKKKTVLAIASVMALVVAQSNAVAGNTLKVVPQATLDWQLTPEGVAFAALDGDRFAGSYMAMVRLPGGLASPVHSKSAGMYGIVISGKMTHVGAEHPAEKATVLQAGGYYRIPAGLPHISSCVSDEECVTFLYQDGPFDFLPVQGSGQ